MSWILILFITLAVLSYVITKLLIRYAHKKQLLDIANERSSHTQATPRIGGLSFVPLICLTLIIYSLINGKYELLLFTLLPILGVAATGLIDDIKGVNQVTRFMLYLFCSIVALGNMPNIATHPYWLIALEGCVLSLSIAWLTNLFNFMDGIDGITASEGIFVFSALAFFAYLNESNSLCYLLILIAAPLAGFLALNWQPAKTFMGDVGSTFIGILIGCMCLYSLNQGTLSIYSAIILLGSFLVDASWTLAYRFISGQQWYQAHRSHHYQILSRKLNSHHQVSLLYLLVNLFWLLPLALAANQWKAYGLLITAISLLPLMWLCFIIGAGKAEKN